MFKRSHVISALVGVACAAFGVGMLILVDDASGTTTTARANHACLQGVVCYQATDENCEGLAVNCLNSTCGIECPWALSLHCVFSFGNTCNETKDDVCSQPRVEVPLCFDPPPAGGVCACHETESVGYFQCSEVVYSCIQS